MKKRPTRPFLWRLSFWNSEVLYIEAVAMEKWHLFLAFVSRPEPELYLDYLFRSKEQSAIVIAMIESVLATMISA